MQESVCEFQPMLGPCEDWPVGSMEWAERISNRLQTTTQSLTKSTVFYLKEQIKMIWKAEPHPWEIWPKGEPFGTADDYCKAVTGHTWEALVGIAAELTGDDELRPEKMQVDLAKSQVEHRPQGTRTDQHPYDIRKLSENG